MNKLLIIGVLTLLLIFACKGKGSTGQEAKQEKKELVYWSLWNKPEPQAQALNAIAETFSKEDKGASLKIIYNGRQALVKLRSYLAANNPVDLFDGDGDQYLGLVTKEDLTVDLSDIATGSTYDSDTALKDALLPGVLDVMSVNGRQYGVPYIMNVIAFFYSKKAFEQANISSTPKTFDDLVETSKKLQAGGIAPIALEGNVGFYQLWYLSSFMQRAGGEKFLFDVIQDKTGASWDKPEVRLALEAEKRLVDSGAIPPESAGYQYPAAQNNIAAGKTAMELVGSWLPTELEKSVPEDFVWGAFPFPSIAGGSNENKVAIAPMTIGIYKGSQNIELAKGFIRYLLTQKNQEQMAKIANIGVPNKSVAWPTALKDAKGMLLDSQGAYLSDGNLSAFIPDFTTKELTPVHTQFILGKLSVDEFIKSMKEKTISYWKRES